MGTDTIVGVALLAQAIVGVLVWILAKRGSREKIAALTTESEKYCRMWREQLDLNIDNAGAMGEVVMQMYQTGTNDGRAMAPCLDRPSEWDYGDNTHPVAAATDLARFRQSLHRLDGLPDFDYHGIPKGVV